VVRSGGVCLREKWAGLGVCHAWSGLGLRRRWEVESLAGESDLGMLSFSALIQVWRVFSENCEVALQAVPRGVRHHGAGCPFGQVLSGSSLTSPTGSFEETFRTWCGVAGLVAGKLGRSWGMPCLKRPLGRRGDSKVGVWRANRVLECGYLQH